MCYSGYMTNGDRGELKHMASSDDGWNVVAVRVSGQ